jgi:hypothetical protein
MLKGVWQETIVVRAQWRVCGAQKIEEAIVTVRVQFRKSSGEHVARRRDQCGEYVV